MIRSRLLSQLIISPRSPALDVPARETCAPPRARRDLGPPRPRPNAGRKEPRATAGVLGIGSFEPSPRTRPGFPRSPPAAIPDRAAERTPAAPVQAGAVPPLRRAGEPRSPQALSPGRSRAGDRREAALPPPSSRRPDGRPEPVAARPARPPPLARGPDRDS